MKKISSLNIALRYLQLGLFIKNLLSKKTLLGIETDTRYKT